MDEIKSVGGEFHIYPYDLSSREQVLRIVPDMIAYGHEVDVFVHCAGIQHRCPAEDFGDTEWDNILNVNLTAGFQISRDLAKNWLSTSMKEYSGQGARKKILFVASVMSFLGGVEIPAYNASKGAIASLTKALNNEWMAKGINVNASKSVCWLIPLDSRFSKIIIFGPFISATHRFKEHPIWKLLT